jgi:hypothetical protein
MGTQPARRLGIALEIRLEPYFPVINRPDAYRKISYLPVHPHPLVMLCT